MPMHQQIEPRVRAGRRPPPRLQDVAVAEGAHRTCVQAARAGACPACIAIVDAIIDRGRTAAKQRRFFAS